MYQIDVTVKKEITDRYVSGDNICVHKHHQRKVINFPGASFETARMRG